MLKSEIRRFGSLRVRAPLVLAGQRVGIMGGSFNPPHDGHLVVAHTALRRLGLDQLWWMVTPGNPLKDHAGLPSQSQRMELCRRLARAPAMKVTGFEAQLGTPFTAATLCYLVRRYPGVRFVWVMGADNLAGFDRWQHWREIARLMPVAVIDRPTWRLKAASGRAARTFAGRRFAEDRSEALVRARAPAWVFLTTRLSTSSSTALRQAALRKP